MLAAFFDRPGVRRISGAIAVAGIAGLMLWNVAVRSDDDPPSLADLEPVSVDAETEAQIVAFCGDCHAMPRPASFPRDYWHAGVRRGYEFYARSGRSDLDPPAIETTVQYYRSLAPERLTFHVPEQAETPVPVRFATQSVEWSDDAGSSAAISHLKWASLRAGEDPVLVVCDMRGGSVSTLDFRGGETRRRILARLDHPCHVEICDLDGNGSRDLVVADLGSFSAADHDRGRVIWLRPNEQGDRYEPIVIAAGLGRVADVRPIRVDDQRVGLLVAEFGHLRTGGTHLLRNVAAAGEQPKFELQRIDSRPGTIHLLPHDFSGDGRTDFAALVGQHSECVDLFINQGNARFHRRPLWMGPDLSFGSSGISLADVNGDGQVDILYTNGDSFDNQYANPSHGIQWLENLGGLRFAYHRVTDLPGAYSARAGDFNHDGRADIVATAWLPQQVLPVELRSVRHASVILLTQDPQGGFTRHQLAGGLPHGAALEVGDFDHDGDLDFAIGLHVGMNQLDSATTGSVEIWWNQGASGK